MVLCKLPFCKWNHAFLCFSLKWKNHALDNFILSKQATSNLFITIEQTEQIWSVNDLTFFGINGIIFAKVLLIIFFNTTESLHEGLSLCRTADLGYHHNWHFRSMEFFYYSYGIFILKRLFKAMYIVLSALVSFCSPKELAFIFI